VFSAGGVTAADDAVVIGAALEAAPPPPLIDLGTAVHCFPDTVVRKFPAGRVAIMNIKVRHKSPKRKERQPSRRGSVEKASSHESKGLRRCPRCPRRRSRHSSTMGCLRRSEIQ
jgi:hypothetical protein